jgi:hypothetical protein
MRTAQRQSRPTTAAGRSAHKFPVFHLWRNHNPLNRWLPIMKAYENNSAAYFATPPVNLIYAFHASLTQIMQGSVSLEQRFKLHQEASRRVKKAAEEIGFRGVPLSEDVQANGMTAVCITPLCHRERLMVMLLAALLPQRFRSERYHPPSIEERCCRRWWLTCQYQRSVKFPCKDVLLLTIVL